MIPDGGTASPSVLDPTHEVVPLDRMPQEKPFPTEKPMNGPAWVAGKSVLIRLPQQVTDPSIATPQDMSVLAVTALKVPLGGVA